MSHKRDDVKTLEIVTRCQHRGKSSNGSIDRMPRTPTRACPCRGTEESVDRDSKITKSLPSIWCQSVECAETAVVDAAVGLWEATKGIRGFFIDLTTGDEKSGDIVLGSLCIFAFTVGLRLDSLLVWKAVENEFEDVLSELERHSE